MPPAGGKAQQKNFAPHSAGRCISPLGACYNTAFASGVQGEQNMRILVVAMANSVHVARWLAAIADQEWDVHLLPSVDVGWVHPDLRGVTVHHSIYSPAESPRRAVRLRGFPILLPAFAARLARALAKIGRDFLRKAWPDYQVWQLQRLIRRLQPDLIHAIELQGAGYLVLKARQSFDGAFPRVMVTNYGSDISLFGRLADHREKIEALLALADVYACECERDVVLAREYGFQGEVAPVMPNSGGFDLGHYTAFRQPGPVSARRTIFLKGYQHWAGRSLFGLRALALCADALAGYRVVIIPASEDVALAAALVAQETGLEIEVMQHSAHDEILRPLGEARIYIGLSISDGISHMLLEGMVMGAFPIQSNTACADEWIEDGATGLIVPPEDPAAIAAAIRKALSDDALVDRAAERNAQLARERLDRALLKPSIVALYERAVGTSGG